MSASDDDDALLGVPHGGDARAAPEEEVVGDAVNGDAASASDGDHSSSSSDDEDDGPHDAPAAADAGEDGEVDLEALAALMEEGDDAAAPAVDSTAVETFAHIQSKKQAKKELSKSEYKRWKKLHSKNKKHKSKSSKKASKKSKDGKKKDKKEKKDKKRDAASGATKSKRKSGGKGRGSDDEDAFVPSEEDDDDEGALRGKSAKRPRRAAAQRATESFSFQGEDLEARTQPRGGAKKKPTKADQMSQQLAACTRIVEAMMMARRADNESRARGEPPLRRIQLVPSVVAAASRLHLHEYLIRAGFLRELGGWLVMDNELAPEDLRTAALNILELIPFEGVEGGKRVPQRKHANGDEDIDVYDGATAEDIKQTNLGFAANKLRQHPKETPANRAKATYLLQRLSIAFNGGRPDPAETKQHATKLWPTQNDPRILAPFEPIKSASERFAEVSARVDPLDPQSYMRVPPARFKASYVSGMFDYSEIHKLTQRKEED